MITIRTAVLRLEAINEKNVDIFIPVFSAKIFSCSESKFAKKKNIKKRLKKTTKCTYLILWEHTLRKIFVLRHIKEFNVHNLVTELKEKIE